MTDYRRGPYNWEADTTLRSAPDTRRGILAAWHGQRARFYCLQHGLQTVVRVNAIEQLPSSAVYDCVLSCNCGRAVVVNVKRAKGDECKVQ